jgi:toxin-antitoxin system PIN domain toxin
MIVPDINLILYAEIAAFPEHAVARRWWERLLSGLDEVALTSPVVFGFVRIATNPRMFDPPLAVNDATDRVTAWLERPNVRVLVPGPRHLEIAFRLLRDLGAAGNLTTDAQLAAFAIENNATLHSNDTDFARFPGLRADNPLRGDAAR